MNGLVWQPPRHPPTLPSPPPPYGHPPGCLLNHPLGPVLYRLILLDAIGFIGYVSIGRIGSALSINSLELLHFPFSLSLFLFITSTELFMAIELSSISSRESSPRFLWPANGRV